MVRDLSPRPSLLGVGPEVLYHREVLILGAPHHLVGVAPLVKDHTQITGVDKMILSHFLLLLGGLLSLV